MVPHPSVKRLISYICLALLLVVGATYWTDAGTLVNTWIKSRWVERTVNITGGIKHRRTKVRENLSSSSAITIMKSSTSSTITITTSSTAIKTSVKTMTRDQTTVQPSVWDTVRRWRHKWLSKITAAPKSPHRTKFTIQMLTYNRLDILPKVLAHYARSELLDRIVLQWNNVNVKPQQQLLASANSSLPPDKLFIELQVENKLTNRMRLSRHVRTECVLLLDDDVIIPLDDLHFAFRTWMKMPQYLVGFTPRAHLYNATSDRYTYVSHKLTNGSYSLILTGMVFLHRLYFEMFRDVIPASIYELIDRLTNCEDLVMNVFITLLLEQEAAGRLVATSFETLHSSGHAGLWKTRKHFTERNFCINKLLHEYGKGALRYARIVYRRSSG